jgi:hypothetical protein
LTTNTLSVNLLIINGGIMKTYKIMAKSKYGKEEVDTAEGEKTARYLIGEYRMAFGIGWEIWAEDSKGKRLD